MAALAVPPKPRAGLGSARQGFGDAQPVWGVPATLCPHPALPREPGDSDGRICPLLCASRLVPQLRSHPPAVQADVISPSQGAFSAAEEGPWGPWCVPTVTEPGAHGMSSTGKVMFLPGNLKLLLSYFCYHANVIWDLKQ